MEKRAQQRAPDCEALLEHAKERIEQVEARVEEVEKANTNANLAESRVKLAETRTELAETRAALAEARAQQAETTLLRVIQKGVDGAVPEAAKVNGVNGVNGEHEETPVAALSIRQREILRLIAEGQSTKQIAALLDISPKTVEYHRGKLMRAVGLHDIPSLVRLAVRAGLVPGES